MSAAIITDHRGVRRDACGMLHTPTVGWRAAMSPGAGVLAVIALAVFLAAPVLGVVLLGVWLVAWLLWWFTRGRQRAAEAMATEGRCPSCAYDIAQLPVADDGCTICPECGGAWRVGCVPFSPHAGR
jgi:hypothetical protein